MICSQKYPALWEILSLMFIPESGECPNLFFEPLRLATSPEEADQAIESLQELKGWKWKDLDYLEFFCKLLIASPEKDAGLPYVDWHLKYEIRPGRETDVLTFQDMMSHAIICMVNDCFNRRIEQMPK